MEIGQIKKKSIINQEPRYVTEKLLMEDGQINTMVCDSNSPVSRVAKPDPMK